MISCIFCVLLLPQCYTGGKLTGGSQEEQDQDPVDPEEQEGQEGDEGLQGEQGEVDEDLPRHVEQSDGQSDSFPHEQHQQQQDDLEQQNQVTGAELRTVRTLKLLTTADIRTVKMVAATA